jgi:hypothetical protein
MPRLEHDNVCALLPGQLRGFKTGPCCRLRHGVDDQVVSRYRAVPVVSALQNDVV